MEINTINARSAKRGCDSSLLASLPLSERLNASAEEVRTTTILDYIVRTDTKPCSVLRSSSDEFFRQLVVEEVFGAKEVIL